MTARSVSSMLIATPVERKSKPTSLHAVLVRKISFFHPKIGGGEGSRTPVLNTYLIDTTCLYCFL
jgi:hypothetical protein